MTTYEKIKQWIRFHILGHGPHGIFCGCPKKLGRYVGLGCPNPNRILNVKNTD